jgi:Ni/Co efflux regulator RcnB
MKILVLAAASAALLIGAAGSASAQPMDHAGWSHDQVAQNNIDHAGWAHDQGAGHHWNNGERMGYNDWNGASRVDYRQHHLSQPPRGYEWRESNGQYVLGAVATGVITSIILENAR